MFLRTRLIPGVLCLSFFLLSLGCFLFAVWDGRVGGARPGLEITPPIFDAGSVRQGEIIASVFQLKNATRSIIQIESSRSSCSCSVSSISNRKLHPGEICEVRFSTDTDTQ
jgi:Protein of unknown function (DUF1573)